MADDTPNAGFTPGSLEYMAAVTQPPPELREQQMMPSAGALTPPPSPPSAIQGSINAGQTTGAELPPRPIGTSGAGQQPPSKAEFFRDMLGKFFYAVGTGLANRGSGPDADARGAGAALTALPQRDIMQQQLEIQKQNAQAAQALKEAQADQYTRVPVTINGQTMYLPGTVAKQILAAQAAGASRETVAQTGATAKEKVAQIGAASKEQTTQENIASKEKLAGTNLAEKVNEFKATDQYKRWKTQLDNDTKIKVADLTASKAPAAMLQTASFSQGALEQMSDAQKAMHELEKQGALGKNLLTNKVEAYLFGHGLADPSWDDNTRRLMGRMQAALGNTATATMRAHTGRTSQEIYEDYKVRFGAGQSWAALRGAMDETGSLLQHYVNAASNANIKKLRSGNAGEVQGGEYDFVNGQLVPRKLK
jgi:hypothetical protein